LHNLVSERGQRNLTLFFVKKVSKVFSVLIVLWYIYYINQIKTNMKVESHAERLLTAIGLENQKDYIWSLQGPTVILTVSGQAKMAGVKDSAIKILTKLGIQILGL
jgi:hypothetical protein